MPNSIPGLGRSLGREHGNPLQCSCVRNPMDRGAWRAMVHRVTKSLMRLKRLSMPALITTEKHCLDDNRIFASLCIFSSQNTYILWVCFCCVDVPNSRIARSSSVFQSDGTNLDSSGKCMRAPSVFSIVAIVLRAPWHLIVVSICIYPMINNAEHFSHLLLPLTHTDTYIYYIYFLLLLFV